MKPTQQEFTEWRTPRRGAANPEVMTNPFWRWAVENPQSGYEANEEFGDESSFGDEPCWSFERFGQSKTELADGSVVYVAGEHEDSYDPDFFIYNDVVVVSPEGEITIYGYPEEIFPATDFHTATLIGDEIVLVGSLSYFDKRDPSRTQVCVLDTKDWGIKQIVTSHDNSTNPGWISRHESEYDPKRNVIRISGMQKWTKSEDLIDDFSTWELDLTTWQWSCVEVKNWSQYCFKRKDGQPSNLFQLRMNLDTDQVGFDMCSMMQDSDLYQDADEEMQSIMEESMAEIKRDTEKALSKGKPELLPSLYHPDVEFIEVPRPEVDWEAADADEQYALLDKKHPHNHYRIEVDGVPICFIEETCDITMRVEGELDEKITKKILKSLQKNLTKVEGVKWGVASL